MRWDYENKPRRAKKIFVNVFKFAILLMCFATVFAVVLTAGVFDTGFDSGANVAEAAASLGDNNIMPETHYSSAFSDNTISGFNNSFHSSSNVIDSSINKDGSVTLELDLSTISFNGYFQGYTGATFAGMDYYVYGNSEEGNYSGSFGVRRNYFAGGTDGVVAVSNIAIPTVIKDLIGGGYTVNINWSGGFMCGMRKLELFGVEFKALPVVFLVIMCGIMRLVAILHIIGESIMMQEAIVLTTHTLAILLAEAMPYHLPIIISPYISIVSQAGWHSGAVVRLM